MHRIDWIGWISSLLLIASITKQVAKQWRVASTVSISKWLYIGQLLAEVGFVLYSLLLRNWVFVFTNFTLLLLNLVGLVLLLKQRGALPLHPHALRFQLLEPKKKPEDYG